jgi:hypothetical protein
LKCPCSALATLSKFCSILKWLSPLSLQFALGAACFSSSPSWIPSKALMGPRYLQRCVRVEYSRGV